MHHSDVSTMDDLALGIRNIVIILIVAPKYSQRHENWRLKLFLMGTSRINLFGVAIRTF